MQCQWRQYKETLVQGNHDKFTYYNNLCSTKHVNLTRLTVWPLIDTEIEHTCKILWTRFELQLKHVCAYIYYVYYAYVLWKTHFILENIFSKQKPINLHTCTYNNYRVATCNSAVFLVRNLTIIILIVLIFLFLQLHLQ